MSTFKLPAAGAHAPVSSPPGAGPVVGRPPKVVAPATITVDAEPVLAEGSDDPG